MKNTLIISLLMLPAISAPAHDEIRQLPSSIKFEGYEIPIVMIPVGEIQALETPNINVVTPTLVYSDDITDANGVGYQFDKRFTYPYPQNLDDIKHNVRMAPQIFEQLVTTAINTPNTNTEPLLELLERINAGKISHNLSKKYTRITHKDFYHRLLPYIPYHSRWETIGVTVTLWTYVVQVNSQKAYIDVAIWGQFNENADERITLAFSSITEMAKYLPSQAI